MITGLGSMTRLVEFSLHLVYSVPDFKRMVALMSGPQPPSPLDDTQRFIQALDLDILASRIIETVQSDRLRNITISISHKDHYTRTVSLDASGKLALDPIDPEASQY